MAYLEFLRDVDAPIEMETQAYIDNFVFGRDPVSSHKYFSKSTILGRGRGRGARSMADGYTAFI